MHKREYTLVVNKYTQDGVEILEENKKKITTFGLVMMIITAIFGFGNVSNAYAQMGYGSIIWYIYT